MSLILILFLVVVGSFLTVLLLWSCSKWDFQLFGYNIYTACECLQGQSSSGVFMN